MTNAFQRINIAAKIPQDISEEVIKLSGHICRNKQTNFVIDGISFIPHITFYSPEYPISNTNRVLEAVSRIIEETRTYSAHFADIRSHLGYIDVAFEKTEEWTSLHERIVDKLNPLRDNHLREKYINLEELKQYSDQQQKLIKIYGYSEVLDFFSPHLTICQFKDADLAKKVANSLEFHLKEFTIDTLAAFTMGEHGTCDGIIKEWKIINR